MQNKAQPLRQLVSRKDTMHTCSNCWWQETRVIIPLFFLTFVFLCCWCFMVLLCVWWCWQSLDQNEEAQRPNLHYCSVAPFWPSDRWLHGQFPTDFTHILLTDWLVLEFTKTNFRNCVNQSRQLSKRCNSNMMLWMKVKEEFLKVCSQTASPHNLVPVELIIDRKFYCI